MRKYKMNYGLSFFMSMSTCVYIILLMITLTDILISIAYKNIEIIIVTYSIFIGMFILFSIISLAIYGIGKLCKKEYVLLDNDRIIYGNTVINIYNISNIDFVVAEMGTKYSKGVPYGVNIRYKTLDTEEYILIKRFPIKLIKEMLKINHNIEYDKSAIKQELKKNTKHGLLLSVVFLIVIFISDKMGCD